MKRILYTPKPQLSNNTHHQTLNMKSIRISGYLVEISICDGSTNCWIEKKKYGASLAALQDTGVLETTLGGQHAVNPDIIDQITAWAEANGY